MMQTVGGATALMYACQQCRELEVLEIIKKQPHSVKERDRTSKTPLHYCAENVNTSCAEAVLRAAPELVNAQDENGYCTLHLAVIAGNKALIKLLITKGAHVNLYDNEGHSAVHWAIVSSEKEALEMIIRAGANPSTPDVRGGYPLHYAVQMCGSSCDYKRSSEEAVRVVETLLNFGVDVNVKDRDSRQPILWAASAGSADAVVLLVSSGACVEAADKDGLTALHCAASRGHTTTLETLISLCGANVDVIDGNGCSALFYAVTLGHADATELLLQLGAEPNRQDRKGRTPAHCGAAKGQLETLRILEKHGGNLWLRNVKGDIALHEAVASGRKDLVLWLLSQNPEAINIANNDGRCPLHIASMYNNTEMVKVLLDSKSLVNPVMKTSKGVLMTPLNVALCKGHRSCGKYLQLHGGVPFSKVARLEPASVFAVRVSSANETELKTTETNREVSLKDRSSAGIQGSQQSEKVETVEKRKVYRKRKKRRSHSQRSDSDESEENVKVVGGGGGGGRGRRSDGSEVHGKDQREERMKAKKVHVSTESLKKEKGSNESSSGNMKPHETIKKETKSKTLTTNKSFNETKNVSDLSPEDFPPLMAAVSQLDAEMMEADIEGEGACVKQQEGLSAALDSGCVGLTKEGETAVEEGNERDFEVEDVPVCGGAAIEGGEKTDPRKEVKEEEIGKEVASSEENPAKDETERKSVESKLGGGGSAGRLVQPQKISSISGSDKKEEKFSRGDNTRSSESEGSGKQRKGVRAKSPNVAVVEQTKETLETVSLQRKDNGLEKVVISTDVEVKENQLEARGANGDVTFVEKIQPEDEQVNKPERVTQIESENRETDLSNSNKSEEKEEPESSENNLNNENKKEKAETSGTRTPAEKPKDFEEKVKSDVIVTETVQESVNSSKGDTSEVNNEMKTSSGAEELPSGSMETENAEEHSSGKLDTESFAAENTLERSPKEVESSEDKQPKEASERKAASVHGGELSPPKGRDLEDSVRGEESGVSKQENEERQTKGAGNEDLKENGSVTGTEFECRTPKGPKVSRLCRRQREFRGEINDVSVTQLVQNTLRKYQMERGIFYQLLELKRYQIRSGKANEQVLVKRLSDEYERSRVFLGMKPYSGEYKFREFEKFLYDQLKALNCRRSFLIPEIKSYDDIDALSGFLKKSRYKIINDIPQPETVCTCITQRCHHSAGAYTSVPCSAYITDLRRHRRHRPKREGLFPRIQQTPSSRPDADTLQPRPATLELIQGSEKHVITLPQNSPGKGKRYYVTFTIKGAPTVGEQSFDEDSKSRLRHRHAKSV